MLMDASGPTKIIVADSQLVSDFKQGRLLIMFLSGWKNTVIDVPSQVNA